MNYPCVVGNLADFRFFVDSGFIVVEVADDLFKQVVHRNNTHKTAVFVQYDTEMVAGRLHLAEQNVRVNAFGNEVCGAYRFLHELLAVGSAKTEIVFDIQHTHHIVNRFAAYGIYRMARFVNGIFPRRVVLLCPEDAYVGTVCCEFADGTVVKFEHVLNHFLFLLVDNALLTAFVDHKTYLLLADLFILLVRVDS